MKMLHVIALLAIGGLQWTTAGKEEAGPSTPTPQSALSNYFERRVRGIEGQLEREVKSKEDWLAKKDEYRRELAEMLGLDPAPPRSDLKATITGEVEEDGIVIEKLHYQSMPGLYVTANLYRPKTVDKPLPTILNVCGHSLVVKNGYSYGNKTGGGQHGLWYAKHGFVCMVIDTVELGEIRGEHHGLYSKDRWWWLDRGYTPAGVEAWAGIRGLDYLETRPEVDKTRFGVTGRSGGGASSWWIAALDERVKAAVPTAGITDLRNYVVDGCVEGHCDCMFFFNTYRWDYDKVAALVAPRALCIANTDKDIIFPIDGVFRIYEHTRRIYKLLDAEKNIGMQIAEGPHADTEPLYMGEFHWMTRFLQGTQLLSTLAPSKVNGVEVEKLRVFSELPRDERNTTIDETFVPLAAKPSVPATSAEWAKRRDGWMKALKEKCFAGWSHGSFMTEEGTPPVEKDGVSFSAHAVDTEPDVSLTVLFAHRAGLKPADLDLVVLNVLDEQDWKDLANTYASHFPGLFPKNISVKPDEKSFEGERKMFEQFKWGMAYICPRGIGPTRWDSDAELDATHPREAAAAKKARVQRLRRFYLVGQTLEGQQVWDIRGAIASVRSIPGLRDKPLWLQASRRQAGNALYASLFEENITRLDLHDLPHSHRQGPDYLNVLKYLDLPQAVAMAAERTRVVIYDDDKAAWDFAKDVSGKFGWSKEKKNGLQLRNVPK
jgi:cephalosporin-C deacetylase-like acetyl esterase